MKEEAEKAVETVSYVIAIACMYKVLIELPRPKGYSKTL